MPAKTKKKAGAGGRVQAIRAVVAGLPREAGARMLIAVAWRLLEKRTPTLEKEWDATVNMMRSSFNGAMCMWLQDISKTNTRWSKKRKGKQ